MVDVDNTKTICEFIAKSKIGLNTEVSYQLLPEWWGYVLATEVIKTMIEYSFEKLGLTRLVAETQTANNHSCRLLERVGMKLESKLNRFNAEQSLYSN